MTEETIKQYFGVAALIYKSANHGPVILGVARRNDENQWGLVGGKIDKGETPEQAILREVKEETGLIIDRPVRIGTHLFDDGKESLIFACNWSGDPVSQPGEPKCQWLIPSDMMHGIFGRLNAKTFYEENLISKEEYEETGYNDIEF